MSYLPDVATMRALWPWGTRVRLIATLDDHATLRPGTEGTVAIVDDMGTVHVTWDNGSRLGLVAGEDRWELVPIDQERTQRDAERSDDEHHLRGTGLEA